MTTRYGNTLSAHDVARRQNCTIDAILAERRQGVFPAPILLGKDCIRWRLSDIELYEQWLVDRHDLRANGFDPETAALPVYSLPPCNDEPALSREYQAAKAEVPPEDQRCDKELLVEKIAQIKSEARKLAAKLGIDPLPAVLLED